MLSPETVASLTASLAAIADGPALPTPELQVISEYAPVNGPTCLDLNLIHESVWRGLDTGRQLPERVRLTAFTDLMTSTVAEWLPRQPRFTIVGFTLLYDDPADPFAPPTEAPTRVVIALDTGGRRYLGCTGAGWDGTVDVVEAGAPLPVDVVDRLSGNLQVALAALSLLVAAAAAEPHHGGTDDDRELNPGEIVTVTAINDQHADTPRNQAFVVIDGIDHPRYTIAALGGDGYRWPNQPREWLQAVAPAQLRQEGASDGNVIYVVD